MFLKRLTVHGFKSFADKLSLHFDRGITGIVGPNGSGKSNVIDAVRWVMGEQNARNLRGEKATDIIFAGSDKRKALTIAEVALTFDNSEEDGLCPPEYKHDPEITLMRRLYADGEREYFINKKECRLKDMLHFFTVAGISGRSYSMIQQGQVDRILNAKPEDVREILEEAAGTLMFKTRKADAEKKLVETRLNLSRVQDIVMEIERQQDALKNQVEKAQAWKKISDEMRDEELKCFAHNYTFFTGRLAEIDRLRDVESVREADALGMLAQFESRAQELQSILDSADPELATLNEELSFTRESIARCEATILNARDKSSMGEKRQLDIDREIEEESAVAQNFENEMNAAQNSLTVMEAQAEKLREILSEANFNLESDDESQLVFRNRLEDMEDEIRNIHRLTDSNKLRAENFARDIEKNTKQQDFQKQKIALLVSEMTESEQKLKVASAKLNQQKSGLEKEINEKHAREKNLAESYEAIKAVNISRDQSKEAYLTNKAKLQSLESLAQGATDTGRVFSELKTKEKSDLKDLTFGLLTDYIKFTAATEELPEHMTKAFERWAERLLVKNVEAFSEIVRGQQKYQLGSLNLSILSFNFLDPATKEWSKKNKLENIENFIEVDTNIAKEVKDFLKNVFYTETLRIDEVLLRDMPRNVFLFTPQGVIVSSPSEILICSGSDQGLISRKIEVEELAVFLKESEKVLAQSQSQLDALDKSIQEDRENVARLDVILQGQNKDVLEVMAELQSFKQIFDHKKDLLTAAENFSGEIESQQNTARKSIDDLGEARNGLELELKNLEAEALELRDELARGDDKKDEQRRMNQQRETDLARADAQLHSAKEDAKRIKIQFDMIQKKLMRRYEEKQAIKADMEQVVLDAARSEADIERLLVQRDFLTAEILKKREDNAGVHEELKVIDARLRECRERRSEIQRLLSDKNLEAERLKLGIESVKIQSLEKYHVDISQHEFTIDANYPVDKQMKVVNSLRQKLEAMGPVNLMAMQEYDELATRSLFVTTQRDEINASIEVLNQAILEIEITSKDKFSIIFIKINEEFGKLFPILFPGGEAHLQLTNPEDPLNGGVEIMVRLPGKKPQNMNLFSGGEKALTAISLIFALLRTKPTPFCFLDEVDAPLDEANVGRYNRVLQALSEQFQFVVITHNRRTMEVLDTLYGVTMQEGGVSTVVGVDMKKDLPDHLKKAFKDEPTLKRTERVVEGATSV